MITNTNVCLYTRRMLFEPCHAEHRHQPFATGSAKSSGNMDSSSHGAEPASACEQAISLVGQSTPAPSACSKPTTSYRGRSPHADPPTSTTSHCCAFAATANSTTPAPPCAADPTTAGIATTHPGASSDLAFRGGHEGELGIFRRVSRCEQRATGLVALVPGGSKRTGSMPGS